MKKNGILNSDISKVLADLGHTDEVIIADCGLPVPDSVKKIDLALRQGTPGFIEVLDVVVADMKVEHIVLAEEIKEQNHSVYEKVLIRLEKEGAEASYLSHEEFKERSKQAKAIIRTGEVTPYANVILQAGVLF
ncbi:D-ribose pyranase [Alkalibacterium sp.]|nr:MAG: D-ribose pyranase [Alkalibacterium sp.]